VRRRLVYTPELWREWVRQRRAELVPGAGAFLAAARERGVAVYFVTNRRIEEEGDTVANLAANLSQKQNAKGALNQEELLAAGALHNVLFGLLSYADHATYNEIHDQAKYVKVTLDQVFLMHYGEPIGTLAPRAANALGLPEFFVTSVNIVNTPISDQDPSQACLTTAKAIAETQTLGLGDWEVSLPQTPIQLEDKDLQPLIRLAHARPGILEAA